MRGSVARLTSQGSSGAVTAALQSVFIVPVVLRSGPILRVDVIGAHEDKESMYLI